MSHDTAIVYLRRLLDAFTGGQLLLTSYEVKAITHAIEQLGRLKGLEH